MFFEEKKRWYVKEAAIPYTAFKAFQAPQRWRWQIGHLLLPFGNHHYAKNVVFLRRKKMILPLSGNMFNSAHASTYKLMIIPIVEEK